MKKGCNIYEMVLNHNGDLIFTASSIYITTSDVFKSSFSFLPLLSKTIHVNVEGSLRVIGPIYKVKERVLENSKNRW